MALSFSFGYYAVYKSSKSLLITFDLINKYVQDFKYISNKDENFLVLATFPQKIVLFTNYSWPLNNMEDRGTTPPCSWKSKFHIHRFNHWGVM